MLNDDHAHISSLSPWNIVAICLILRMYRLSSMEVHCIQWRHLMILAHCIKKSLQVQALSSNATINQLPTLGLFSTFKNWIFMQTKKQHKSEECKLTLLFKHFEREKWNAQILPGSKRFLFERVKSIHNFFNCFAATHQQVEYIGLLRYRSFLAHFRVWNSYSMCR